MLYKLSILEAFTVLYKLSILEAFTVLYKLSILEAFTVLYKLSILEAFTECLLCSYSVATSGSPGPLYALIEHVHEQSMNHTVYLEILAVIKFGGLTPN